MAPALARELDSAPNPTRERLLDVAETLFAERGLAGVSVRDIATRAELTPAALYNHFAGKEALYAAVLGRGVLPLIALLADLADREQNSDNVDEVLGAVMEHLSQRPQIPRLIYQEAVTGGTHLTELARDWIRPLVERGLAETDRDPTSLWSQEDGPLFIVAWLQMIFGFFATSPLLKELLGKDPLSEEVVAAQTQFLRKLARLMIRAREVDR